MESGPGTFPEERTSVPGVEGGSGLAVGRVGLGYSSRDWGRTSINVPEGYGPGSWEAILEDKKCERRKLQLLVEKGEWFV